MYEQHYEQAADTESTQQDEEGEDHSSYGRREPLRKRLPLPRFWFVCSLWRWVSWMADRCRAEAGLLTLVREMDSFRMLLGSE